MDDNLPNQNRLDSNPPSGFIDDVCGRFEAAWKAGQRPKIEDFLPSPFSESSETSPATLQQLLLSLVAIDLEMRWKTANETGQWQPPSGEPAETVAHQPPRATPLAEPLPNRPRLADYVARYPALGPLEGLPVGLVHDEYYARRRNGDRPIVEEYVKVFGKDQQELAELLQAIEQAIVASEEAEKKEAAAEELEPGEKVRYFGDYVLLKKLGKGGMGVVYEAEQVSLKRRVAVKMVLAGQLADEEDIARFHFEAESAANLDHPGIVQIFEIGEHDGHHYFSMQLIEGEGLDARLLKSPLPPREAARLMVAVAQAVAYAHSRGVVHRDLKPANILVDAKTQQPHITDFGLAKRVEGGPAIGRRRA